MGRLWETVKSIVIRCEKFGDNFIYLFIDRVLLFMIVRLFWSAHFYSSLQNQLFLVDSDRTDFKTIIFCRYFAIFLFIYWSRDYQWCNTWNYIQYCGHWPRLSHLQKSKGESYRNGNIIRPTKCHSGILMATHCGAWGTEAQRHTQQMPMQCYAVHRNAIPIPK